MHRATRSLGTDSHRVEIRAMRLLHFVNVEVVLEAVPINIHLKIQRTVGIAAAILYKSVCGGLYVTDSYSVVGVKMMRRSCSIL